jgi:hypothetical protein
MAKTTGRTPATKALLTAGVTFTLHAYEHADTTTSFGEVELAAADLGSITDARVALIAD